MTNRNTLRSRTVLICTMSLFVECGRSDDRIQDASATDDSMIQDGTTPDSDDIKDATMDAHTDFCGDIAQNQWTELISQSKGCGDDSDCALIDEGIYCSCSNSIQVVVNKQALSEVNKLLSDIRKRCPLLANYSADANTWPGFMCDVDRPKNVRCESGRCTADSPSCLDRYYDSGRDIIYTGGSRSESGGTGGSFEPDDDSGTRSQ